MSHVYVEQNYAQNLIVGDKTILNSNDSKNSAAKQQKGLLKTVKLWGYRSRQRKQLSQLSDHLLKDVGLTEVMVAEEIAKPFWKK